MDFVKKFAGDMQQRNEGSQNPSNEHKPERTGGFLGGLGNKLNSAAGGGRESEKNEDYLDKGEFPSLILLKFLSPNGKSNNVLVDVNM